MTRTFANGELGNIASSNIMHKSVSLNDLSDEGLDNISSRMIADNEMSFSNSMYRSVSLNSLPNEELGNIASSNIVHKSVNLDEFLKALDVIEKSSNSENLNYWEISCKVSLPDNKAELRCLAERNDLKDVYIIGTFPAGFSMNALGLKNDRSYYYSGTGMEQDLYKGFFQSLKDRCPRGDCRIYTGDYDSKNNKLIYDTNLEYPCN